MALGKTRKEIRQMSAIEFQDWQLYYLLEPFGFHDLEYRTSAVMAAIHNSQVSKRSDAKRLTFYVRDMLKLVIEQLKRLAEKRKPRYDLETVEGRKAATKELMKNFSRYFGAKKPKDKA